MMKKNIDDRRKTIYEQLWEKEPELLNQTELTRQQQLNGMLHLQKQMAKLTLPGQDPEKVKFCEIAQSLQSRADRVGLREQCVYDAMGQARKQSEWIAQMLSGLGGEKKVRESLKDISGIRWYQNLVLSDGEKNCEIDFLVVSSRGLDILEVKNYSKDVQINEGGVAFRADGTPFPGRHCAAEQLAAEEALLRSQLGEALEAQYPWEQSVRISSHLVFSNPQITVKNDCPCLDYCFTSGLARLLSTDAERCARPQMERLCAALEPLAQQKAVGIMELTFEQLRGLFADALAALEQAEAAIAAAPAEQAGTARPEAPDAPAPAQSAPAQSTPAPADLTAKQAVVGLIGGIAGGLLVGVCGQVLRRVLH